MHLTPHLLLNAYYQGVFPMAHDDGNIYWYDPNPRAIIPLDDFHVPRRLARVIRRGGFEVRFDFDFRAVITACAEPAEGREKTWINDQIIDSYCQLYELGFAHSVETWIDGQLAGGLYGVSLQGVFAGESMFSRAQDTSKIALVYLVEHLRSRGFVLLDTQFITPHLARFGAIEIPRAEYKTRLAKALRVQTWF
ncbi:MAG: leucyl/phenylalanyl-tRNA--protein transferase [Anaerolineae bacterium]|nr:leucyl/phenylalanyl-tRNA--protein transferase [Anaerolineae bacterium]MCB0182448.1 leucyl/phenylalanyl-tRNA--protein transferase [Anaerolineae bacterium]MCB9107837.1 leucyl/phenylalanyl-tRNA--protein transferase [Anaerolineales bacterium]